MFKKKRVLTNQQAASLLPSIESFNQMASVMIDLLNKKIDAQQKRLRTISHVVNADYTPPTTHSISVSMIDIANTKVTKTGKGVTQANITWEDEVRRQQRGFIL